MCGIAGIFSRNPELVTDRRIRAAAGCLAHRGPDSDGMFINPSATVALGHRRLRIIDLTAAAAQPMHYRERYTIVHNGELYNYVELRQELLQKGYSFNSASDTEVIVAAYDAWGAECLSRFDGMFAFAVWDEQQQRLFAARDRFGEKPFFFYYDEEQLVFASEQRAFWQLDIPRSVNRSLLYNFLSIGYTTNPADPQETFFESIRKLPAASFLEYEAATHELSIQRYWDVEVTSTAINTEEAIRRFEQLFATSIRNRLRSDVAIGTSLSGGLDSSSIVAFCQEQATGQYSHDCFTASFPGEPTNEDAYAKMVADRFHLHDHLVNMDDVDIVSLMHEVMRHQEEPFGSASVLVQHQVFRAAKAQGITVLLDGQGADEVLAGYHKYYRWYWQELFRAGRLRQSGEQQAAQALGIGEKFSASAKLAAKLPELAAAMAQSRQGRRSWQHPDLDRDFAFANKRNLYYALPTQFDLNGALYFNTFVQGLEELLRLADRNSMAHGVEIRLPFLDHRLVEFLFSLPANLKIREGWTKWILRRSVQDRLPAEIAWRRDKIGFEPPQKKWMERKEVRAAIIEAKKKLAREGILTAEAAGRMHPHASYAKDARDWRYWSASFLFGT